MLDGYTYSNLYPYSEAYNRGFNYIRNSVVVTIDAYQGTVDYYVKDKNDPIIQTYSAIFPSLFKDFQTMPQDLQEHIRYPKQLFAIQSKFTTPII